MNATPEDLVETWHLFTANGDDPVEWIMDESLWNEIERCIRDRECIDAGDPLPIEGARMFLGTPVEITATTVPRLRFRRSGEIFVTPIFDAATEQRLKDEPRAWKPFPAPGPSLR